MRTLISKLTIGFSDRSADQLLLIGVFAAAVFFIALYFSAVLEDVLLIKNGVGLLQNYGLFAALIGDAILFYLAKKYFESAQIIRLGIHSDSSKIDKKTEFDLLSAVQLQTRHRFIAYIFLLVGMFLLSSNIAIHILGNAEGHWRGDVFDSLRHPVSFYMNKLFLFYSWVLVIPLCAYVATLATITVRNAADTIASDTNAKYDLLHSDNSGGFAEFRYANVYVNLGLAVIYLQISLYTFTFKGANFEHILGYIVASLALIFANIFIFKRVDEMIARKRAEALDAAKGEAYDGDKLRFEIFRYYLDVYSKKSLRRRLSFLTFSIKSIAIAIPPAIKGITLLTSSI